MTPVTNNPNELLKGIAGVDNKIDKGDFKKAEKVFDDNYDEFMKGSGNEILALFDKAELTKKIGDVVEKGISKTPERLNDGDRAYLVLKALNEGKKGDYTTLLKIELGKLTLEHKRLVFIDIINKDKSFSEIEKEVLYSQLNEEFARASNTNDPVGNLEKHFLIALVTIKGINHIVEGLARALDPRVPAKVMIDLANICYKKGIEITFIAKNIFDKVIEKGKAADARLLAWLDSINQMTKETVISLIKAGSLQRNNFADFCSNNREKTQIFFETTTKSLIETGKIEWNAFADFCSSNREKTQIFFETTTKSLIETGKVKWNAFADFCSSNREKTQIFFETTTKSLIETGKIEWNAFADFCSSNREKTQIFFETTTKSLIETGKVKWNAFADFCSSNREKTQIFFETTTKSLIEQGTLARDTFTVWCADKRETVKVVAGNIAKDLYETGKMSLDIIFQGFFFVLGTGVLTAKFIIKAFAYTGEKLYSLGKDLARVIYVNGKKTGKAMEDAYVFLSENVKKDYVSTLNRIEEIVGDARTMFETLIKLGKITLEQGLNWLSYKYTSFTKMRKEIGERKTVKIDEFVHRVGNSRQNVKEKTTEFSKNIAEFMDYLVNTGTYDVEMLGKFFVKTGEKISIFYNKLIELKGITLNKVAEWYIKGYKSAEKAFDQMLELGIGAWDKLGEIMYDTGVAMETIAKLIYKHLNISADKMCDFFLGLYKNAVDKIDEVVDIVAKAIRDGAIQVRERAYQQYIKTMDSGKAAIKALEDAKEWTAIKIEEMGNWLLSKGISAMETIKILKKEFNGSIDAIQKFLLKMMDKASEAMAKEFRAAAKWLSDIIPSTPEETATTK